MYAKNNVVIFLWRRFPSSLWFLLLNLVGHIKRCLHKNIGNILWFSFGDMTVPFQKTMYRHCDLDPWPMKVKLFLSIDYDPISVLYQIQSDMSTNSREIKYQNSEKSLSLIIEWLVSMATKKIRRFDFHDKFLPWFSDQNASAVKKSGRSDQYWGLYIVQLRTNGDRPTKVHRSITEDIICQNFRDRSDQTVHREMTEYRQTDCFKTDRQTGQIGPDRQTFYRQTDKQQLADQIRLQKRRRFRKVTNRGVPDTLRKSEISQRQTAVTNILCKNLRFCKVIRLNDVGSS